MTTHECFQAAERIERAAAEIYTHLASVFSSDSAVRDQFRRLADEEVQHATRIQLLAASQRGAHSLFAGVRDLEVDILAVGRDAEKLLTEVKAGAWGTDLTGVKARLASMEHRLSEVHAQKMAKGADPSVAKFFEALANQDREHKALIEGRSQGPRQPATRDPWVG